MGVRPGGTKRPKRVATSAPIAPLFACRARAPISAFSHAVGHRRAHQSGTDLSAGRRQHGRPFLTLAGTADLAPPTSCTTTTVSSPRAPTRSSRPSSAVKVGPDRLLAVLAGCAVRALELEKAMRFGQQLAVTTADGTGLSRAAGWAPWQTTAAVLDALTVHRRTSVRAGSAFSHRTLDRCNGAGQSDVGITGAWNRAARGQRGPGSRPCSTRPQAAAAAIPMSLDELGRRRDRLAGARTP